MDSSSFDVIVIGAGIAGATCSAQLAADRRVALIEAEEAAGYHSTGRSAAIWMLNYGPPDVRHLTGASRAFFESPPEGFADVPLMSRRPVAFLAPPEQVAELRELVEGGSGLREITPAELRARVPALREGYAEACAIEEDSFDMDVATLHQGFLRQLRARGGTLALRSRTGRIEWRDRLWQVEVTGGAVFHAPVVVNAAGAWGDLVAAQAGAAPLGLVPKRRTGVIIDPAPWMPADWPMVNDVAHTWYCRAEARTKLMC
ncbi:MAG TPA: FAD-binding oxidoreductase, partial [Acetobacteraceae bacterium]